MNLPDFEEEKRLWKRGFVCVAGADEVGRGALAGPVVAGAVVFAPAQIFNFQFSIRSIDPSVVNQIPIINDSKKLNKRQRERADEWIRENCLAYGIGEAPASYINKAGIVRATCKAFRRALKDCNGRLASQGVPLHACDFLLVDAFYWGGLD